MEKWAKRIGRAFLMGLAWAIAWAAVGVLIATLTDSNVPMGELWLGPPIGLHPGFVGGVVFSVLLAMAAPGRRLAELSLLQVSVSGAAAGLLLGLMPLAINKPPGDSPLWLVGAVVIGSLTILSALSAAASLAVARSVKSRG